MRVRTLRVAWIDFDLKYICSFIILFRCSRNNPTFSIFVKYPSNN